MQIEIRMKTIDNELISYDYLYSMSAMLNSELFNIAPEFSKELHNGVHKDKIKLFTFSPLNSFPKPKSVNIEGQTRQKMLLGKKVYFRISSPWPELLNALGQALLSAGEIRIMNKSFKVEGVNMIAPPQFKETMTWRPFGQSASICTSWTQKGDTFKQFIYPDCQPKEAPVCSELITDNLIHKYQRLTEVRPDIVEAWQRSSEVESVNSKEVKITFLDIKDGVAYKKVRHQGKSMQTRTWRCPVEITAPIPIQKLIWANGLGEQNSQGYGLVTGGNEWNS